MTRILRSPDVFASCPLDGKIIEYYSGTFEAVYISLNPFMRPRTIGKAEFKPGSYPNRRDIVANCESVSWSEVKHLARLPSLAAVDIGLRTMSHGLKAELENQSYASAIDTLYDSQNILTPLEGHFPDLLHDRILQGIQELGYEWLWVGDEF